MPKDLQPATLYIVGTPIGNLEDITFRAIRILQTADLIAAEDTRHTGKLLQHFQITTPQISYHEHNKLSRQQELLDRLKKGEIIALVTDAGMPGISDPGYELVKACIEASITVIPIPGVTAAVTALAASGLPSDRFVFEGFIAVKAKERRDRLNSLKYETRTLIFYEAPHRLLETLSDLASILGENRQIVLARELTKVHEEFWRGTLEDAIALYTTRTPKGEFTLVVAGTSNEENLVLSPEELKIELKQLIEQGMTRSQASRQLAQLTNIPRRQIYQLATEEE
ncbi:16S rRNA (cytidine(1402)-2'-O)-methyltransferase [Candidatus Gracilibacteria bacterium]|nr:16S rRNA (cytidine(1402)-2'-O)-methyltransferase [Candidatus Gracilibacteria bacterium]NJM90068.1 16S rRNA (cytidine(1402)-2'-O)-methyltransferase [Hydrococcus sp. RU_2_2]NJP20525.1 16S rRNA (cytidine(1402)-2'-O)-methyltransferase [Hydrococcus sp. CRU_1_1]